MAARKLSYQGFVPGFASLRKPGYETHLHKPYAFTYTSAYTYTCKHTYTYTYTYVYTYTCTYTYTCNFACTSTCPYTYEFDNAPEKKERGKRGKRRPQRETSEHDRKKSPRQDGTQKKQRANNNGSGKKVLRLSRLPQQPTGTNWTMRRPKKKTEHAASDDNNSTTQNRTGSNRHGKTERKITNVRITMAAAKDSYGFWDYSHGTNLTIHRKKRARQTRKATATIGDLKKGPKAITTAYCDEKKQRIQTLRKQTISLCPDLSNAWECVLKTHVRPAIAHGSSTHGTKYIVSLLGRTPCTSMCTKGQHLILISDQEWGRPAANTRPPKKKSLPPEKKKFSL